MPFNVAKRTIDYLFSEPYFNSESNIILDFIGGEPLLEISLIDQIISYFRLQALNKNHLWYNNYSIRITTNGLLYNSPDVQQFIRNHHEHLNISISIDGNKDKTDASRIFPNGSGSYDLVIKAIPLWRKQFPKEGTKMTISHDDLPYVSESVKHLISLGITKIDINPVLEDVWQSGDDKIFEKQLINCADYIIDNQLEHIVDLSCFEKRLGLATDNSMRHNYGICGSFTFTVDYKGDFYTCLRFAKFSLRTKEVRPIGNITDGVNWNLMRPFKSYCNQITSDRCIKCELHNGCKICPAENYDCSATASIFEQSQSSCLMHKAKVKAKNYFWNKLSVSQAYYG